jgi:hypothetical protein
MAALEDYRQAFSDTLGDWHWRLNNLYLITDKEGRRTKFRMNWAQEALFNEMHFLNVILKARQLGFTTFIQLFMLDACVFNSNVRAGTIAHTLSDAQAIFRDKIKYPYDNLPESIRAAVPVLKDSATELMLGNNSIIRVGTSHRSGTLNYLHISEYGKLNAKHPEKAREVRTGALNTVQVGQVAFIESTAEGQEGHFYELCQQAQAKGRLDMKLTPLDFKFFFFPWWRSPEYEMDASSVPITEEFARYFDKLEQTKGIILRPNQKAWYVKKAETQLSDMKREFPSTPEEAFEASLDGAYYADQMATAELQGRIGAHRLIDGVPVNTAWDIGVGEYSSIWLWQQRHDKIGLVGYYQNVGEGMPHYVSWLKEYRKRTGCTYGVHVFPHDVKVKEWGIGRTRLEQFVESNLDPRNDARMVKRHSLDDGINAVRETLRRCWFDAEACDVGLKALRSYRKEWDEERGVWCDRPRHDAASHGADAFRQICMYWRTENVEAAPIDPVKEMLKPKTLNEVLEGI